MLCYRNKPTLVMKMFRCMRFCYFFAGNYLRAGNVAPVTLSNVCRISTLSRAACPVREKVTSLIQGTFEEENYNPDNLVIRSSLTRDYWDKFLTSDRSDIIWDECLTGSEVPKEKYINTYAIIFLICQKKKLYDCAESFFKYLWDKREITPGLLNLFCTLMLECPAVLKSCEDMIFKIFLSVMNKDKTSVRICSTVLLQSSKYSNIVYECYKDSMIDDKYHDTMLIRLLEKKEINKAIELYAYNKARVFGIEKLFLENFLQQAAEGQPPVDEICKFLKYLPEWKAEVTFPEENMEILKKLFKKLRAVDENYHWMVNKSPFSPVCSFCKGELEHTEVTQAEINLLLKDLEDKVIIQDNIFIKTNQSEWKRFCSFIEKKNYNLVMDGLNVKYAIRDYTKFEELISKITSLGLNPLVLGRSHFQTFPEYRLVKTKFPIFLTDNLSDDDVFVLYAALKKGKGCYTLSNDKMNFCNNLLSSEKLLSIYKRWKATHQCRLTFWKTFMLPSFLLGGIQKCRDAKEGEFRYHYISNQGLAPTSMTCVSRIRKDGRYKS